jgi:hypothetical protein
MVNFRVDVGHSEIKNWLYNGIGLDESTPIDVIYNIVFDFDYIIRYNEFELAVPFDSFKSHVINASCMIYKSFMNNVPIVGIVKPVPKPDGWNNEMENIWMDYLYTNHFDDYFWSSFWNKIAINGWEEYLPRFRALIQSILPLYVKRNPYLLQDNELLYQDDDGNYLMPDDMDDYYDDELAANS